MDREFLNSLFYRKHSADTGAEGTAEPDTTEDNTGETEGEEGAKDGEDQSADVTAELLKTVQSLTADINALKTQLAEAQKPKEDKPKEPKKLSTQEQIQQAIAQGIQQGLAKHKEQTIIEQIKALQPDFDPEGFTPKALEKYLSLAQKAKGAQQPKNNPQKAKDTPFTDASVTILDSKNALKKVIANRTKVIEEMEA